MKTYKERAKVKGKQLQSFKRWITSVSPDKYMQQFTGMTGATPLRTWIESQFTDEMNWCNYGRLWVIDHIVPLRMFDLTNPEEMKIVWNYKNLMPLLRVDNLHKQGDLRFSLLALEKVQPCHIVDELKKRALAGVQEMEKYLDRATS